MKKQILSVAAALVLSMIAAGQCVAQQQRTLQVNVPFAFGAGNKMLPAGEYTIRQISSTDETVQVIRQLDGEKLIIVITMPIQRTGKAPSPRLIFHQYGNDYFLAEVWDGTTYGRQLSKSRGEKELASTASREEVALLADVTSGRK